MTIEGKTAYITGGCGDIGMGTARAFLEQDTRLVLFDRDTDKGDAAVREDDRVRIVRADLSDTADIDRTMGALIADQGAPDILVNNVGIAPKWDEDGNRLSLRDMSIEEWNRVIATNLTSCFYCTKLVLPGMMAKRYGRIVNIGSYTARNGGSLRNAPHYVASKAGVLGLTKSTAIEGAAHGVHANAVNPGRILTAMSGEVPEDKLEEFASGILLGRLGEPKDIANVVAFLVSTAADYLTGAVIEANGGIYLGS